MFLHFGRGTIIQSRVGKYMLLRTRPMLVVGFPAFVSQKVFRLLHALMTRQANPRGRFAATAAHQYISREGIPLTW